MNKKSLAGLLLFATGVIVFMGIITAEAYYPTSYTTFQNEISDLGATRPPDSVSYQPSAAIFDGSMMAAGALILAATYLLRQAQMRKLLLIPLGLFGLGVLGVGIFPGDTAPHPYMAMLTFLSGGIAAVLSAWVLSKPFGYAAGALGFIALTALFFNGSFQPFIGPGGIERWIAYPITLWLTGLGGYLMASTFKES